MRRRPRYFASGEPLLRHDVAAELLYRATGGRDELPTGHESARRVYPEGERWQWVIDGPDGPRRVEDPDVVRTLDARFAFVERLYRSHPTLGPHLRPTGAGAALRPVEDWEWSCIGLHGLWACWNGGRLRVDLRPALLELADGEREAPTLSEYELSYVESRVRLIATELAAARGPAGKRERRRRWHGTVAACVLRHDLGPEHGPSAVLAWLLADGLALRRRGRVTLATARGPTATVRTGTLLHVVRLALEARTGPQPPSPPGSRVSGGARRARRSPGRAPRTRRATR